ncbi:MAG: flippase [Candidatus Dormibacteraceae bacterium]
MEDVPADGVMRSGPISEAGPGALRNTTIVLGARVAAQLLALVTVVLLERHLRPAGTGRFVDVVNVSALVAVIMDLGFNPLFQREGAREPTQIGRFLSNLATARGFFALVALAVFGVVLAFQGKAEYIVPGFFMMLLSSYSGLLRGAFYAVRRLGLEAVAIILQALVLLSLVAWGVHQGGSVTYFLWSYAGSYLFVCGYYLVTLRASGIARIGIALDLRFLRHWIWQGLPFALAFLITTIYFKIDVPILDWLRGDRETGIYGAAYKPFEALLFIPASMLNVVFPVLSVYHRDLAHRMPWAVARFFKALLILGWPIGIGTYMLVLGLRPIYVFSASAPALEVLSLAIVFMFVNNAFIAALTSIDRQVMFTLAALGSMVVNLALNLVLIPPFGYLGASWATVLTEVALGGFGWVLTARYLAPIPVWKLSWRVLLAGAVMGLGLLPFRAATGLWLLPVIAGAAALYAGCLIAARALDAEEMDLLKRAWSGARRRKR